MLQYIAGLTPYDSHKSLCPSQLSLPINNSPQQTQKQFKNIPFDDYHTLWQGLATSVPAYNPSNKCNSAIVIISCFMIFK